MQRISRILALSLFCFYLVNCGENVKPPEDENSSENASTTTTLPPYVGPTVKNIDLVFKAGAANELPLQGTGPEGRTLKYEIVERPARALLELAGNTVTLNSTVPGYDQFQYRASDGLTWSAPAVVKFYVVTTEKNSSFWLRSEDITSTTRSSGGVIVDWPDHITGRSAHSPDAERTPRYVANFANNHKAVEFEYTASALATNDLLWYPSTYVYSENDGLTVFAVAKNKGFASEISPVVSVGNWTTRGYGLSWNSSNAGIVSATNFGGVDDKSIAFPSVAARPALLVGQILFDSGGGNGRQRLRWNSQVWIEGASTMSLNQLSPLEIGSESEPNNNGAPIMVGANNRYSTQADRRFVGEVAEILIVNRALSENEVQTIESYLIKKYSLQSP